MRISFVVSRFHIPIFDTVFPLGVLALCSFSRGEKVSFFSRHFLWIFCSLCFLFLFFPLIFSMWFAFDKSNWCFVITMWTKCGQTLEHVVECSNFTHFSLINMWAHSFCTMKMCCKHLKPVGLWSLWNFSLNIENCMDWSWELCTFFNVARILLKSSKNSIRKSSMR